MFAKVIVDIRHEEVNHEFDYIIPQEFEDFLVRGMRVLVPFGTQTRMGYVINILDQSDSATKEIIEVLDVIPSISEELFTIVEYIMSTSPALLSSVLMTVMPSELLMNYQKIAKLIDPFAMSRRLKGSLYKKRCLETFEKRSDFLS
jgi:primosomal protein N' (replication factor Y) (superfamily II helicase)